MFLFDGLLKWCVQSNVFQLKIVSFWNSNSFFFNVQLKQPLVLLAILTRPIILKPRRFEYI